MESIASITAAGNGNVITPFMNSLLMLYLWAFKCAMAITCIKVKNCLNLFNMNRMLKTN